MNPASAKTSVNQVPALLTKIMRNTTLFPPPHFTQPTIFDFGAGKEGKLDAFLKAKGIGYLPYDPFNRPNDTNIDSVANLDRAKFVICCNVLNVIEDEHLDTVIAQLAKFTSKTQWGVCLLSVYHRASLPINRQVNGHFQRNQPLDWYMPKLNKWFSKVEKDSKVLLCCS
jgi:hypothetical protein